jgi:hypothetical protein
MNSTAATTRSLMLDTPDFHSIPCCDGGLGVAVHLVE